VDPGAVLVDQVEGGGLGGEARAADADGGVARFGAPPGGG
jgi:hypothetical protein